MKLTNTQLKKIIKEELNKVLKESFEMSGERGRTVTSYHGASDSIHDAWSRFIHSVDGANETDIYTMFDMYQQQHPERAEEMRQYLNHMHSYLERPL